MYLTQTTDTVQTIKEINATINQVPLTLCTNQRIIEGEK